MFGKWPSNNFCMTIINILYGSVRHCGAGTLVVAPAVSPPVCQVLLTGDPIRHEYDLFAWAVMPNHVHLALKPSGRLSETMQWQEDRRQDRRRYRIGGVFRLT